MVFCVRPSGYDCFLTYQTYEVYILKNKVLNWVNVIFRFNLSLLLTHQEFLRLNPVPNTVIKLISGGYFQMRWYVRAKIHRKQSSPSELNIKLQCCKSSLRVTFLCPLDHGPCRLEQNKIFRSFKHKRPFRTIFSYLKADLFDKTGAI